MKLTVHQDAYPDELKKGEAIIFSYEDGTYGLIICCPQCGRTSSSTKHKFNKETQTHSPSVIHDQAKGGCGAHYWIRNGEFIFC